jgi:poly(hydroxyalkanoate) depolymerase family esterase
VLIFMLHCGINMIASAQVDSGAFCALRPERMPMRNLGDTVARLAARQQMPSFGHAPETLATLSGFGSNPGGLGARLFVPDTLTDSAPLVVVLHGCTQTAADYDQGAGWTALAAAEGFAVLFPEQKRNNNPNLCFNWFQPEDVRRGAGEVESIRQMIAAMIASYKLDKQRVFITGLSAGGAMALAMLAAHPEMFAAGAIIAGVPFGAAGTVPEAFDRMRGQGLPKPAALAAQIEAASPHAEPQSRKWPRLSVWQGSADQTVDPANAEAIIASWARLSGLPLAPDQRERINGQQRRVWRDPRGDEVLEAWSIAGMGHGTPVAGSGAEALGTPGPFMLEAGLSSTRRIAAFWGIAPEVAAGAESVAAPGPFSGAAAVIDQALRQAGLLR